MTWKGKGNKTPKDSAALVAGGDVKGDARYCFGCGDPGQMAKDCPKKGNSKCIAHPEATSHENHTC